ncbi:MAG: hypothetical protein IJL17_07810 [Kiritimatiellae bacterium]|nr:hypothetical protein [Kiritimatiellia bacterium]
MRRELFFAALLACAGGQAMPLGLRTAMWGVARARGSAVSGEDDPIPALAVDASPAAVAAALNGSRDGGLAGNIGDATCYRAYYDWARGITNATATSALDIKQSSHAWLSFALGADALIARVITSNDVHIVSFEPSAVAGRTPYPFMFEVAIDGVNIGGGAVAAEMLKANLKKVFEVEGASTLEEGMFTTDNIEITFDAPANGRARFAATPPVNAGKVFFMRVKVK